MRGTPSSGKILYGGTNIIALGRNGEPVSNTHVSVWGRQQATVTLQRGAQRTTYNCSQPLRGSAAAW